MATFERLLAMPMGAAFAALWYSLWSRQRRVDGPSQTIVHGTALDSVGSR